MPPTFKWSVLPGPLRRAARVNLEEQLAAQGFEPETCRLLAKLLPLVDLSRLLVTSPEFGDAIGVARPHVKKLRDAGRMPYAYESDRGTVRLFYRALADALATYRASHPYEGGRGVRWEPAHEERLF